MTLGGLLRDMRARLAAAGVAAPDLDARLIVEHFTGTRRIDALRDPDREVDDGTRAAIEAALQRRLAGEPVHRILGFREFYGLPLSLSPQTLEPRPDTEALVDLVLPRIRAIASARDRCDILDLGTGTGAIALAILSQVAEAQATASDISEDALATAAANAGRLGLAERFEPMLSDWYENISGRFDAILSNPPYIDEDEMRALPREVAAYDPETALFGGKDGLDAYRAIAAGARVRLNPGGFVAVEIGSRQRQRVAELFATGGFALADEAKDLAGRDRALLFEP